MARPWTRIATLTPTPSTLARSEGGKRVSWIFGQVPRSEEEKILYDALTQRGLQTVRDVKAHLADTLYWRDFLRGGWATDIGLLRPLYAREAQEIIDKLEGVSLLLEEDK